MQKNYPHEIVDDIAAVPEAERKNYVPLTKEKAKLLLAMTPEQRGVWLRAHPIDADLVTRIRREEAKMGRRQKRALANAIEAERRRVARGMKDGTL